MKTETSIKCAVEECIFGYWDDEQEKFIPIDEQNRKEFAQKMDCSEKLLEAIEETFSSLVDMLKEDLTDIWKKLE